MSQFSSDAYRVNVAKRMVVHKQSGIEANFYPYCSEADWRRTDSVILRLNPAWGGDLRLLAAGAKAAALAAGMRAS